MAIDNRTIDTLSAGLQRIFAMKVSKSTYREIQNLILALTEGKDELADSLLQGVAGTDFKEEHFSEESSQKIKSLAKEYAIPVRLSKEVLERGEFINLLTSDSVGSNKGPLLLNRVRRIDGDESQFITDMSSTVHILQHFSGRLLELSKNDDGKEHLKKVKQGLENAQKLISDLLTEL